MALAPAVKLETVSLSEIVGEGVRWASGTDRDTLVTGIDCFDRALEGGLPTGVLCELVAPSPSSGSQTMLLRLLEMARRRRCFAALVDGSDSFDPQTSPPELLEHLLWVRCRSLNQALQAADTLLRDENLGMILIDLRECGEWSLRRARSSVWYRLQRLGGKRSAWVVICTPRSIVPSSQIRLALTGRLSLEQSDDPSREIAESLTFDALRLRNQEMGDFPQMIQAG